MNKLFSKGDRVKVNYYGVETMGTVKSERMHTQDWNIQILQIEFDNEVEVHGMKIKSSSVWTSVQGAQRFIEVEAMGEEVENERPWTTEDYLKMDLGYLPCH